MVSLRRFAISCFVTHTLHIVVSICCKNAEQHIVDSMKIVGSKTLFNPVLNNLEQYYSSPWIECNNAEQSSNQSKA